jgi:hypothetical protein
LSDVRKGRATAAGGPIDPVVVEIAEEPEYRVAQAYNLVAQADERRADKDREGHVREHGWISKKVDQSTPT